LLLRLIIEWKTTFQLGYVSKNKALIFSPPKFTDPRLGTAGLVRVQVPH